jgi:hypothetical protein
MQKKFAEKVTAVLALENSFVFVSKLGRKNL